MSPSLPDRLGDPAAIGPEQQAGSRQIGRAVLTALGALPEGQRRSVTLYLQGHSVPEIASMLEIDRKKAENQVYRGLAALREDLQSQGITPAV